MMHRDVPQHFGATPGSSPRGCAVSCQKHKDCFVLSSKEETNRLTSNTISRSLSGLSVPYIVLPKSSTLYCLPNDACNAEFTLRTTSARALSTFRGTLGILRLINTPLVNQPKVPTVKTSDFALPTVGVKLNRRMSRRFCHKSAWSCREQDPIIVVWGRLGWNTTEGGVSGTRRVAR